MRVHPTALTTKALALSLACSTSMLLAVLALWYMPLPSLSFNPPETPVTTNHLAGNTSDLVASIVNTASYAKVQSIHAQITDSTLSSKPNQNVATKYSETSTQVSLEASPTRSETYKGFAQPPKPIAPSAQEFKIKLLELLPIKTDLGLHKSITRHIL